MLAGGRVCSEHMVQVEFSGTSCPSQVLEN